MTNKIQIDKTNKSKLKKDRELNIKIIDELQFLEMIDK